MKSVLLSLLIFCGGPTIVFDDRPDYGVPPEALAQKPLELNAQNFPKTFHAMSEGTIKTVRVRYFNKATWAKEEAASEYLTGFLADTKTGVFSFQIWSQLVGTPEIDCVVEFSDDYLKKLRQENTSCHSEGRLIIWNTEACFRDSAGRWWFLNMFDYFHQAHPNGTRRLANPALRSNGSSMPVGKWIVEFANGVVESCEIRAGGMVDVTEPGRGSGGKALLENGSFVIHYEDERVERWTPVGKRIVVEHWPPGSRIDEAKPVLGVAERAE